MVAHSLLLSLTRVSHPFTKIFVYDAPDFFPPCTLNSTAIVAARGVSSGHSDLGDLLMSGFTTFSAHIENDAPAGVQKITQYTGTKKKLDEFRKRYPDSVLSLRAGSVGLTDEHVISEEPAFQVTPFLYLKWIKTYVSSRLPVEFRQELFMNSEVNARVVYCGGIANRFWKQDLAVKSAQGSYLEFSKVGFDRPSFSMTLDGHNIIYNDLLKTLLLGSTTHEAIHYLAPEAELRHIHSVLLASTDLPLPHFESGVVKVGLREKAPKRMPYMTESMLGGLYKNGFSLSLEWSNRWCARFLHQ